MVEEWTVFVVQSYDDRYDLWSDCAERSESMFSIPRVGFDTEEEGRAKYDKLRAEYPTATFRFVKRTTTTEML
jgi:hypothetical protein